MVPASPHAVARIKQLKRQDNVPGKYFQLDQHPSAILSGCGVRRRLLRLIRNSLSPRQQILSAEANAAE
jgi:hypothetical protein